MTEIINDIVAQIDQIILWLRATVYLVLGICGVWLISFIRRNLGLDTHYRIKAYKAYPRRSEFGQIACLTFLPTNHLSSGLLTRAASQMYDHLFDRSA